MDSGCEYFQPMLQIGPCSVFTSADCKNQVPSLPLYDAYTGSKWQNDHKHQFTIIVTTIIIIIVILIKMKDTVMKNKSA